MKLLRYLSFFERASCLCFFVGGTFFLAWSSDSLIPITNGNFGSVAVILFFILIDAGFLFVLLRDFKATKFNFNKFSEALLQKDSKRFRNFKFSPFRKYMSYLLLVFSVYLIFFDKSHGIRWDHFIAPIGPVFFIGSYGYLSASFKVETAGSMRLK